VPGSLEKAPKVKGEKLMSNNDHRVLMRKGARLLAQNEIDEVQGASTPSVLSVIRTDNGKDFTTDE
jgi:hypothetical protein